VGKTALVNALAGQALSTPTSFGPGTETAIAYAHEARSATLHDLLERALDETERIQARSADRMKKSGDDAVPARVVMMHFESPAGHAKQS